MTEFNINMSNTMRTLSQYNVLTIPIEVANKNSWDKHFQICFVIENKTFPARITGRHELGCGGGYRAYQMRLQNIPVKMLKNTFLYSYAAYINGNSKDISIQENLYLDWDQTNNCLTVIGYKTINDPLLQPLIGLCRNLFRQNSIKDKKNSTMGMIKYISPIIDVHYYRKNMREFGNANHCIYFLVDTNAHEIYWGLAENLLSRVTLNRVELPNFDRLRYILINPNYLLKDVEMFAIRLMSTIFGSINPEINDPLLGDSWRMTNKNFSYHNNER